MNAAGFFYNGFVNEHGEPIERTPYSHPHSYDGYVLHRLGKNEEANATEYSDRLIRNDYRRFEELSKKYFGDSGQWFSNRAPHLIENFLKELLNLPNLRVILIMQCCNVSSGYPLWRFDINTGR